MKILFIEDDRMWADGLIDYFTLIENWEVDYQATPAEALKALAERPHPDLILLDVMMAPDETIDKEKSERGQSTGLVLLEILDDYAKGGIPIILLTNRQDILESQYKGKATHYLQKSLTTEQIVAAIRGLVDAQ